MARLSPCLNPKGAGLSEQMPVDPTDKHDSTAIVATHWDRKRQQARLIFHRTFQPCPEQPLDFEATVERTVLELRDRFQLRRCLFDPWQLQSTSQRLSRAGVRIEEFPQSPARLTLASQNLYELIQAQGIALYPDDQMRLAASHAVAIETPRGWRIGKQQQTHKIDLIVALAMSAHAAMQDQSKYKYPHDMNWVSGPPADEAAVVAAAAKEFLEARYAAHLTKW